MNKGRIQMTLISTLSSQHLVKFTRREKGLTRVKNGRNSVSSSTLVHTRKTIQYYPLFKQNTLHDPNSNCYDLLNRFVSISSYHLKHCYSKCQEHQHHPAACQKCRKLSSIPDVLKFHLHLQKYLQKNKKYLQVINMHVKL